MTDNQNRLRPEKQEHPLRLAGEVLLMRSVSATMERASWDACRRAGAWLGLAFFGALRKRRGIAVRNVQTVFPHLNQAQAQRIVRRSMQNFAMTFCEFLHLHNASPEEIRATASIERLDLIEAALLRGRGAILLTAHIGNWELMGARAAMEFPLTVVARPTSNRGIQAHIESVRTSAGLEVLSKYDTARASLQVLRRNRALGILPDQHAGADGLLMPLFGRNTRVTPAVARLAMLTGALVVPVYGVRREPWLADGRIAAEVFPGFEVENQKGDSRDETVRQVTQRTIAQLEDIVRRYPEQWLWVHRRWRDEDATEDAKPETEASSSAA